MKLPAMPLNRLSRAKSADLWMLGSSFLLATAEATASTNRSLWRQSQLINFSGLFAVTDGI